MNEMTMHAGAGIPPFLYVELAGGVIGIVFLLLLFAGRGLGGIIGNARKYIIAAAALFTASFIGSAVIDGFHVLPMQQSMVVHMLLMVFAMVMSVVAAIKLGRLVKHGPRSPER